MAKTLCDWDKDKIEKKWDALVAIVAKPKFACTRCGRVADDKRRLCKPRTLKRKD